MANTVAPFGFEPIDPIREWSTDEFYLTAGVTIYKGDPVIMVSTGYVTLPAAGQTDTHLGIAAEYVSDAAASTGTMKIKVITDKQMRYRVQMKTGLTASIDYVFNTSDIATYAVGSSTTHQSICSLDTPGTSHLPWVILGLWDSPSNAWGDGAIVIVKYAADIALAADGFPGI
jgi:hypothetical protein